MTLCLCVTTTVGERASPPSLVQLKSQFAHVMSRVEDSQAQQSQGSMKDEYAAQHEVLLGFQKFVTGLVERAVAEPDTHDTNLTAEDEQSIDIIKTWIRGLYLNERVRHDADVAYVVLNCQDKFTCCEESVSVETLVSFYEASWTHTSSHLTCRTSEYSVYETHQDVCSSQYCSFKESTEFPSCVASGDLCGDYLKAEEGTTELAVFEQCLELVYDWFDLIMPIMSECKTARKNWQAKHTECNVEMRTKETKWCKYGLHHKQVCNSFRTCWQNAHATCLEACVPVQKNVEGRKICNKTAEQIECLLGVLEDKNEDKKTSLQVCLDYQPKDDSEWNIVCPQEGYDPIPALPLLPKSHHKFDSELPDEHRDCSNTVAIPRQHQWECFVYGLFGDSGTECSTGGADPDPWRKYYKFTQGSVAEQQSTAGCVGIDHEFTG